MNLLLLLVLQSAPVVQGAELIRQFHTYDLQKVAVRAVPGERGAQVRCDLTLIPQRPGPLRFVFTSDARNLRVTRDGQPVPVSVEGATIKTLVRLLAPDAQGVPGLLVLRPEPGWPLGEPVTVRLEYDWMPRGGLAEARDGRIQTHMSSFWIPSMANERFDAEVEIVTDLPAITSGTREKTADGWRFRTGVSAQIVPLVVGPFSTHRRGDIELFLPPGIECEPEEVLEDAERVLALLEEWFGPRPEKEFRIAFAHNPRPMPSYCGGNFILLSRPSTPSLLGRARWISLLAHECAHMWWGHHVGMPVIGQGGNWLREGIPQWVGITAVEKLVGNDEARRRWRVHVAAYLATADLRRDDRGIFANEATLLDSTYLDPPRVAYWRGALVLRRLAYRLGREEFLRRLGVIQKERTQSTIEIEEFTRRMDAEADVAYYARRTRLPDFALDGRVIRCLDPAWPDGKVPVRVTTAGGVEVLDVDVKDGKGTLPARTGVESIEIDPERILLDPVLSNNRG